MKSMLLVAPTCMQAEASATESWPESPLCVTGEEGACELEAETRQL